jgi:hypothetical protein
MSAYDRAVHGAEAGAIAAVALELSFFLVDAVRFTPLATPLALSGAVSPTDEGLTPGAIFQDLASISGALAFLYAAYQVLVLTAVHLIAFGSVGALAALLFDWSEPLDAGRVVTVALMCTVAFGLSVAVSSSMVALGSVGWVLVIGMNLLAALILVGCLRLVSAPGAVAESAR